MGGPRILVSTTVDGVDPAVSWTTSDISRAGPFELVLVDPQTSTSLTFFWDADLNFAGSPTKFVAFLNQNAAGHDNTPFIDSVPEPCPGDLCGQIVFDSNPQSTSPGVPEPSTILLMVFGLAAVWGLRKWAGGLTIRHVCTSAPGNSLKMVSYRSDY